MTAIIMVEMICNGITGFGCPVGSRLLLEAGAKREAREMALEQGWHYTRKFGMRGNWEYLDLCKSCKGRKR